jgi:hypothetical protein
MNDKADCRTAPATPGLLNTFSIIWIPKDKGPKCILCHDMPTSKAAMAKQNEFLHGMDN